MVLGSLHAPDPPEFYALFCTTQIPAQVINKFLQTSEESSEYTPNIWSLILTHSQTHADKPTSYPISGDTITTFTNATFDDLGAFCHEKFDPQEKPQPEPRIAWEAFAVMDERTLEDDTVVVVQWELWSERIDPNSEDDRDEAFRQVEGWQDVRLPLEKAADTVIALGGDFRVHDMKTGLREEDNGVCFRKK